LGADLVCAAERPSTLEAHAPGALLTLDFDRPAAAAETAARFAAGHPLDAVVGVDDRTAEAAAAIAERLGLKTSAPAAVHAARDKHEMRERLAAAGVPVPRFRLVRLADDPERLARAVAFPCVLKPLTLSASRGVIRADDPAGFVAAFQRIAAILRGDDVSVSGSAAEHLLVEAFVPGREVALEGLCSRTLRFGPGMTLEDLILRQALGFPIASLDRERAAAGVMMIPIPRAGRLDTVRGRDAAAAVPRVEEVVITAHVGQELVPLPEGWQYLGFIFSRAETPAAAERALRDAHARLAFDIA